MDCLKGGHSNRLRNVFGAVMRPQSGATVTYVLIGLCVLSFIIQQVDSYWTTKWAFQPLLALHQPWRFLTAAFLHNSHSVMHILFNMYALYMVGPFLERSLGRGRYLAAFVLTAIGGSVGIVMSSVITDSWNSWTVGASGAVFGLFGAAVVILHRIRQPITQFLVILGINAVIGFVVPGIAWQAHVGGFVTGVVLGVAWSYARRDKQRLLAWLAPVAVFVVLVGVTIGLYYLAAAGML